MAKKHPGFYLVLLIIIQILLVFSLHLLARGAAPPGEPLTFSGRFTLVDGDGNGIPDHLGYFLPLPASRPDVVWVCGELQAMIDQQWRTIDYTARSFTQTSGEAALYFYGGELRRLRVNGPFRILIEIRGVNLHASGVGGVSAVYHYDQFEAADAVLTNQGPFSTAQIKKVIYTWASENGIQLGPLQTVTFAFDRWRFDFGGVDGGYGKRVWYAPTGEINWTIQ
ncbi:MAG TPA: hypothetical protein GXX33_06035 [Firmicutes bacterium]|uniref:Uncharacterized protein n=1 Tax=Capillibacterium thermochitinicola TaxID=2699427 RepID=A0A8J6I0B3_9FIRM|nr:hypothetical protein [Capillibacterium thermochitinicola]MBA2131992.1 hypothetical protein [Capillibacterium thermochitinicola]HHW12544.1 hypothetical protein [Bacillota bacterium]